MKSKQYDPDLELYTGELVHDGEAYNAGRDIRQLFLSYMKKLKGDKYKLSKSLDIDDDWYNAGFKCLNLNLTPEQFCELMFGTFEKKNMLKFSIYPKTLISTKIDRELFYNISVKDEEQGKRIVDKTLSDFSVLMDTQHKDMSKDEDVLDVCSKTWFRIPAWFRLFMTKFNRQIVDTYKVEALTELKETPCLDIYLKSMGLDIEKRVKEQDGKTAN